LCLLSFGVLRTIAHRLRLSRPFAICRAPAEPFRQHPPPRLPTRAGSHLKDLVVIKALPAIVRTQRSSRPKTERDVLIAPRVPRRVHGISKSCQAAKLRYTYAALPDRGPSRRKADGTAST